MYLYILHIIYIYHILSYYLNFQPWILRIAYLGSRTISRGEEALRVSGTVLSASCVSLMCPSQWDAKREVLSPSC